MSKSETTSASNWKVIGDGEAVSQGARWEKVTHNYYLFLFFVNVGSCSNAGSE